MARGKRNKNNDMEKEVMLSGDTTELVVSNDVMIIKDGENMPEVTLESQPLIVDDAEKLKLTVGITEPELIVPVVNKTPEVEVETVALKLELNETDTPVITNESKISDKYVENKYTTVNSANSWDLDPVAIKGGKAPKAAVTEDNPFGKKVKTVIDKVDHNKNDERMTDSDLIDNIVML